ncbi:hypothetical protein ACLOJK_011071 [Asimina triloba]
MFHAQAPGNCTWNAVQIVSVDVIEWTKADQRDYPFCQSNKCSPINQFAKAFMTLNHLRESERLLATRLGLEPFKYKAHEITILKGRDYPFCQSNKCSPINQFAKAFMTSNHLRESERLLATRLGLEPSEQ